MEVQVADGQNGRQTRGWLEVGLIAGFILCLVIGAGALAAFLLLRQSDSPAALSAAPNGLQPDRILPQLALMELAGDPAGGLAHQALDAGELDTAYAIVAFTPDLPGNQLLTLGLQMARRFLADSRPAEAARSFRLAQVPAILDSELPSLERAQSLSQAAAGLVETEENDAALDTAVQAKRIAEQAPDLLPAQRSQIFESLRPIARALDAPLFQQQIEELVRNPYLQPSGQLLTPKWFTLGEPLPPDETLRVATFTRNEAARQLANRIGYTGGIDIEPERQTLADALIAEDRVRADYHQRTLASGLTLEQQFSLLQEKRNWLALKSRIAARGFGLSLVPEWEAGTAAIQQDLSVTTANVDAVVEAIITNNMSEPTAQAMLRVENLHWLARELEFGRFPQAAPTDLSERLRFAQADMSSLGPPLALPVDFEFDANPPGFRIQPPK